MPEKRYTKVEEEVIQILDRLESEKPSTRPNLRLVEPGRPRRRPTRRLASLSRLRPSQLSAGRPWIWLVAAIGLAFLAILVRDTSQNLAFALVVLNFASFIAPMFLMRRGAGPRGISPTRPGEIKTWRGRDISLDPDDGPSPADRLGRWFNDRRGGGPRL